MFKMQSVVVLLLGASSLQLGQTSGCDISAIFNVPVTVQPGLDDNPHPDDNGGQNGNPGAGQELILTANLVGPAAVHGAAKYRELGDRMRLSVELEDAIAGSAHDVVVNGNTIGQLTIGALGKGEIEFDTHVEPEHAPWPASLAGGLSPGATVAVGNATGVLAGR